MNANAMPEPTVSIEEEPERTREGETSETREQIRRQVLAERAALPKPYRLHKSSAICDELETSLAITCATIGIDSPACTIAVYAAFEEEVQLDQFIRAAYAQGARVAFPCIVEDAWGLEGAPQQTMEMRLVSPEAYEKDEVPFIAHPLRKYHHDDETLRDFPYVPANDLTMIVIPLVAFDAHHNRLGYGGGNYDRYLPQLSKDCRQIAVAFSEQEVPFIPAEEHDVPVTVLAK